MSGRTDSIGSILTSYRKCAAERERLRKSPSFGILQWVEAELAMKIAHLAAALLTALGAASCVTRGEGEQDQHDNAVVAAAVQPLRDVGLVRPEIPEVVRDIGWPYKTDSLREGCPAVLFEIGRLDAVLGEENYQPGPEENFRERTTDAAVDYVGDYVVGEVAGAANELVPYRGWVRRLSGANRRDKKYAQALAMGSQRRTFLRGYGAALGCNAAVPAPPPPPREDNNRRR
ncbi:MAG: hypothetical protein ABW199_09150 [Caulobacterales bacterium]